MTHLTFEEISELAESSSPGAHGAHLEECRECRETLDRVRSLLASARALPRDIEPPPEVWTSLRSHVGRASAGARRATRAWRIGAWVAAAATIVIVAGATLLLPGGAGKAKGKTPPSVSRPTTPVALAAVEQTYAGPLAELRHVLETQRASLSPATVRVLERSIATIDTAIAEAGAALASDPANQALVEILSANYERKVELLQRATKLSSSL